MIQMELNGPQGRSLSSSPMSQDDDSTVRDGPVEGTSSSANQSSSKMPTGTEVTKLQTNLKARKRTKTGCLTCRKRRIKCGEERPTCANCIKSKRSCEGYAPRLTFKDPLGAFRPGWSVKSHGAHYQNLSQSNGAIGQYNRRPSAPGSQNQLPVIAPRPLSMERPNDIYYPQNMPIPTWAAQASISHLDELSTPTEPRNGLPPRMRQTYQNCSLNDNPRLDHEKKPSEDFAVRNASLPVNEFDTTLEDISVSGRAVSIPQWPLEKSNEGFTESSPRISAGSTIQPITPPPTTRYGNFHHSSKAPNQVPQLPNDYIRLNPPMANMTPYPTQVSQDKQFFNPSLHNATNSSAENNQGISYGQGTPHQSFQVNQPGILYTDLFEKQLAFERMRYQLMEASSNPDDDLFDVDSEEEGVASIHHTSSTPQNDVGLMLALAASQDDRTLRSYTTFLTEPNVLSTYHPKYTASPLMDSTTARIFCHFITATGPSISIYERHPSDPSVMFTGAPVPSSRQALWTYTLPMKALSNQALLHAMLAIASLHISCLQKTPITASLRHYHFALRRLTKALSIPHKRTDIGTIAATLILGHYESTTAEHSKWNRHLAGARQLLMEVDFKGMTKQIREEKARKEKEFKYSAWYMSDVGITEYNSFQASFGASKEEAIDEGLVNRLMGWKVQSDNYGRILGDSTEKPRPPLTEKDLETYRIHSDLFWWYAKQDVYQSVVSGNPPLLPYDRWGHCPPRAPIGRLDAIYGTMDHLVLVMGRIAEFASKDLIRKRKLMKLNGGYWKPPSGMFPGPPAGPPQNLKNQAHTCPPAMPSQPQQPPMFGMIPASPTPATPERFTQAPRDQIYVPPIIDEDNLELEAATADAEAEWKDIQVVLDLFEQSLGPAYASLPDYLAPPLETAFGTAIQYRTWSIACIWVMYYTGRIITARVHPSMPPAALMAAGVAAAQTAYWANTIGRICCGLQIPPSNQPLNPAVGATLMESTLGLFFAGVQYTDPAERNATITRLLAISEMTGLQSSAHIAAGCELCWVKMAEAGRGPSYKPIINKKEKDDRAPPRPAPKADAKDKQLIYVHPETRTNYAMGIMSLPEDYANMSLND